MISLIIIIKILELLNYTNGLNDGKCDSPRSGQCIEIWNCPKYSKLLRRTLPLPVYEELRSNLCGTYEVCCPVDKPIFLLLPPVTTTTTSTVHSIPTIKSVKPTRKIMTKHKNLGLLPLEECGPVQVDPRITNGGQTNLGEFPWMALIAYKEKDEDLAEFRCGGTLISHNFVLTAAHCIENDTILGVRLGEYDTTINPDCLNSGRCKPSIQDFTIKKAIVHPEYDPDNLLNDIALIQLNNSVEFIAGHIEPICLPIGNLMNFKLDRRHLLVSGWGLTEHGEKSSTLLKVSIPVLPISECQKVYRNYKPIGSNQICAGGQEGKDSCGGDSGGPLKFINKINGTTRFVQYGIVSYGPRYCGMDGRPGVYTNVKKYLGWILDNLSR